MPKKIAISIIALQDLLLGIARSSENLGVNPDGWIEEHKGFYYQPLSRSLYEALAKEKGFDTDILQVEILRFDPGASLKPHKHNDSSGVMLQITLDSAAHSMPRLSRTLLSSEGQLKEDLLELDTVCQVPAGCIHGFSNDDKASVYVLSVQSQETENDTVWYK